MTPELASRFDTISRTYLVPLGWHLLGAAAIWIAGGWAIRLIRAAFHRALRVRHVDHTISGYLDASVAVLLRVMLLIAVLGALGIQTTSFAALVAAVGIAIGAAWAGLLSNFAAGLFLLIFRPFEVGDFIAAGGAAGTVREIGLLMTTIDTPDRVLTYVGNNRMFSDNVQNFSASPLRRVDLTAQLPQGIDLTTAIERLSERVRLVPNVLPEPEPSVEILAFSAAGSTLTVRPFCRSEHYWQVYFDTNRAIGQLFAVPAAAIQAT